MVVELSSGQSAVLSAERRRSTGAHAKGARVGQLRETLLERYGAPPAVSKQKPYDVWLYPGAGVGFFLVGGKISTIFLFEVDRPR